MAFSALKKQDWKGSQTYAAGTLVIQKHIVGTRVSARSLKVSVATQNALGLVGLNILSSMFLWSTFSNLSKKRDISKRLIYFQRKKNHVYPVENAAEM